ncbi:alpha/beta hydrolase family protein [Aeromicrobium duanguangcaii]|uniref:Alpha/beta fold hydrolase n=1 Tax=Aeromicrobium duanguangcaii TaxID=2968086 RepID=A0ABY5KI87_9ACTN|nr:alpha/beta fold hydrolase [Aeromicrobium duanguangcaii]MCD9153352.1 alpha/beta fold hydrolase [Aeromicrobium duanguangcaii]UUI69555.1 alpha/beta fold hydrolase [Aeromicrobium duanguangcaii]
MIPTSTVSITCADGRELVGELRRPADPRAAVVLHPATAVPTKIYGAFAQQLAERGHAVLTYDYRGTGRSAATPLRLDRHVTMTDWIDLDAPAASDWLHAAFPGLPMLAIGHSVGGHAIALGAGADHLTAAVTIASHAGITALIPERAERLRVAAILSAIGPLTARALGFVPARRLGIGEDMPAGVMLQWGRWSRQRDYFFDDPSLDAVTRAARLRLPILAVGIDDDPWAAPTAIERITRRLTGAPVERLQLATTPDAPVGHLGFFRPSSSERLWGPVLEWTDAQVEGARAGRG